MRELTIATLMLAATLAEASIYRWVDADGTVRYSDTPPADASAIRVRPRIRQPNPSPDARPESKSGEDERSDQHATDDATSKPPADRNAQPAALPPEVRAKNCLDARERLALLQRTPAVRILYENEAGETTRMTPAKRDERMAEMRTLANRFCD